jgi:diguanylate cyclase
VGGAPFTKDGIQPFRGPQYAHLCRGGRGKGWWMSVDEGWFGDRSVREAMTGLPLGIAVLSRSGEVDFLNSRFLVEIGREALTPELIADLSQRDIPSHVSLHPAVNGAAHVEVLVLPLGAQVLLITEEPHREIAELRDRVEELERLSTTDRLTGVWNRLQMDRMVDAEMSRSARHHQPASLILLDVDHFKGINDSRGHGVGDQVLRELGERLTGGLRILDSLFRWGGEEFVVLAPETAFGGPRCSRSACEHALRPRRLPMPVG